MALEYSKYDVDNLKKENDIEGIINILRSKYRYEEVPEHAAIVLGDLGDEKAVEALIHVINDQKYGYHIREASITSLSKIGNSKAIWALINTFNSGYHRFQMMASEGLITCGENAIEPLINALEGKFYIKDSKRYV